MAMDVRSPLSSELASSIPRAAAVFDGNPPSGSGWSAIVGRKSMRATRDYILAAGLVFAIGLGTPVALSEVDDPVATAALTRFVSSAAAQVTSTCVVGLGGLVAGGDACNASDDDINQNILTNISNEANEAN